MKNWLTYIFLLMAGTLSLLTTSCSQEDEGLEKEMAGEGKAIVQFSIALGNSGNSSRATWGEEYDDDPEIEDESKIGNEFENFINLSKFHVNLIIPVSNTTNETISIQRISRLDTTTDNVYSFKGEVEVRNIHDLDGARIEISANIENSAESFSADYDAFPSKGVQYIPMWGVHTVQPSENLFLVPSTTIVFAEPIYLLRAMAKVEVIINPDFLENNTDIEIVSVGLNKYNKKGNLKPIAKDSNGEEIALPKTKDYNREDCINEYKSLESSSSYTGLPFIYDEESNSYVIYVPEYNNPKINDDDDAVIYLNIKKGDSYISNQLDSKGAIIMTDLNLVRNHWYQYYVNSINFDTDIVSDFKYQVIDWAEINNGSLNFGNSNGNVN